jgi:acetyltransferase
MTAMQINIRRITQDEPALISELAFLLIDAVRNGASVGFLDNITTQEAEQYWQSVMQSVADSTLWLWVAEQNDQVLGTVQLSPCLKPNGRHRAELCKLLVLSAAQGRGISTRLMQAAEGHARKKNLKLLFLDTHTGSKAELMYQHWGWTKSGLIPNYATTPNGELCSTTIFYKHI